MTDIDRRRFLAVVAAAAVTAQLPVQTIPELWFIVSGTDQDGNFVQERIRYHGGATTTLQRFKEVSGFDVA